MFPLLSSSISIHRYREEGPNQERSLPRAITPTHEFVAVSFVEFVFLLEIWFSSSLSSSPHPHLSLFPPLLHTSLCYPYPLLSSRFLISEVLWGKRQEWYWKFMWVIVLFCFFPPILFFFSLFLHSSHVCLCFVFFKGIFNALMCTTWICSLTYRSSFLAKATFQK